MRATGLLHIVLLFLCPPALESLLHLLPATAYAQLPLGAAPRPKLACGGRQGHRLSICPVALGFYASAARGDATTGDTRGPQTTVSVVKKMKRVSGRRAALDPLRYAGDFSSASSFQRLTATKAGEARAGQKEDVETGAELEGHLSATNAETRNVTKVQLTPQMRTPVADDFLRRPMEEVTASANDYLSVLNDQTTSPLPQSMVRRPRKSGQRSWADAAILACGGNGSKFAGQMVGVENLLANRPIEHGDESRIANGELRPQQMWQAGPAVLLAELFHAILLLASVLKQAITMTILVMGLALRSTVWVFEWAMAVGDAKEWWVPDVIEFVADTRAAAKHSRTLAYLRYARARLRMVLRLIYHATAAAVSPAVVLKGEKWVRDLRDVVAEEARSFVATAQVALTESSLPDSGEPQTILESAGAAPGAPSSSSSNNAAVSTSSTANNVGGGGSRISSSYISKLEATRARSAQRPTT